MFSSGTNKEGFHSPCFHSVSFWYLPQPAHIKLMGQVVKAIHTKCWNDFSFPFKMVDTRNNLFRVRCSVWNLWSNVWQVVDPFLCYMAKICNTDWNLCNSVTSILRCESNWIEHCLYHILLRLKVHIVIHSLMPPLSSKKVEIIHQQKPLGT